MFSAAQEEDIYQFCGMDLEICPLLNMRDSRCRFAASLLPCMYFNFSLNVCNTNGLLNPSISLFLLFSLLFLRNLNQSIV